jgi:hypothetical protein
LSNRLANSGLESSLDLESSLELSRFDSLETSINICSAMASEGESGTVGTLVGAHIQNFDRPVFVRILLSAGSAESKNLSFFCAPGAKKNRRKKSTPSLFRLLVGCRSICKFLSGDS